MLSEFGHMHGIRFVADFELDHSTWGFCSASTLLLLLLGRSSLVLFCSVLDAEQMVGIFEYILLKGRLFVADGYKPLCSSPSFLLWGLFLWLFEVLLLQQMWKHVW
jgi:hypothetical protein